MPRVNHRRRTPSIGFLRVRRTIDRMCFAFDARPPALPDDLVLPRLAGGAAGLPYQASVDGKVLPGLNDDVPLPAGTLLRLRTTGGGGWGDPFQREPELVLQDVRRGLVSPESAALDYGVVVRDGEIEAVRRPPRDRPLLDRGPGYEQMRRETRVSE